MEPRLLLATDMDRTVIPNGREPESDLARPRLRNIASRREVVLAYVSGRDRALIEDAIVRFDLPTPDFAVGDVGTTIYAVDASGWRPVQDWADAIAGDWGGRTRADLEAIVGPVEGLVAQEAAKQNRFKLSYYAPERFDLGPGPGVIRERLERAGVRAEVIWSVDEVAGRGLVDVVPRGATKLGAVRFLVRRTGIPVGRTVFAGDSGNDLAALVSELPAVLVANAAPEVREQAIRESERCGTAGRLYLARGGLLGMNGNYAAGVLEGLVHHHPEVLGWLRE